MPTPSAEIHIPQRKERKFLPVTFSASSWEETEPFFKELKERAIGSLSDLENWLRDKSELESALQENAAWRYIKMSCDIANPQLKSDYEFYIQEIEPKMAPYSDELNRKFIQSPFAAQLSDTYKIYLREIRKEVEIYREENIPLYTKIQTEERNYAAIMGDITVEIDKEEVTLQKAASYLKEPDRKKREEVFYKISNKRMEVREKLNALLSRLITLRDQVARNAGFENFRDYMFRSLGRFDYSVKDCFRFHEAISREIVPIVKTFDEDRKQSLGLDVLKPWDTEADVKGRQALKPFTASEELIAKTIDCFRTIRPYYGSCIGTMKEMGHLDLESRKGKAPGGYNYSLHETGVPFIFMNAVGSLRDVTTMVHEGGHAIHSFLTREMELSAFKSTPSEVSELASMSMELISMEHWDVFFGNGENLKRAKYEQLEKSIKSLLWIAAVDKFQHWLYQYPRHSAEERMDEWEKIISEFSTGLVDWSGNEDIRKISWQNQLHIFEVPFYYIEYGIAQLGALAVWRNYKQNREKGISAYENALKLGYTKSIPEIYRTAGIAFDFSQEYVRELADFVKKELLQLNVKQ